MSISNNDPVIQLLREASRKGIFPGAVVCASKKSSVQYDHAVGNATLSPDPVPIVTQALFDVASLTKPVATVTAIMQLIDSKETELDTPIYKHLPIFGKKGKKDITIRHLLSHCSGLDAHVKFYEELEALNQEGRGPDYGPQAVKWVVEKIAGLESRPPETETVYSDLGYIVLGYLVEQLTQTPFHEYCRNEIFLPLGMEDTFFLPLWQEDKKQQLLKGRQVVATEDCPWRKRVLVGEVHDSNCHAMGGVAGHAGLFSTAADIHRFSLTMLRCYHGAMDFLPQELVQTFWSIQPMVPNTTWTLGWDTPSPEGSSAGSHYSASSVGHLAFTGCSMWLDPEDDVVIVLLTNRVHPSRDNIEIRRFRPIIHNTIRSLITEPVPLPPPKRLGKAPAPITPEEAEKLLSENARLPRPSLKAISTKEEAEASKSHTHDKKESDVKSAHSYLKEKQTTVIPPTKKSTLPPPDKKKL
ncbi:MAG TPA: hypothetical protein DCE42_21400 [Myxococcales bacterium]|nr:hypothetical protein [Deltaproteobacteria bacterium]HAA57336.1 hypothetical protein [Myxococcales bacterium]